MNIRRYHTLLLLVALFSTQQTSAQVLQGNIVCEDSVQVYPVTLIVRNGPDAANIVAYKIIRTGRYALPVGGFSGKLLVQVTAAKYKADSYTIDSVHAHLPAHDFILQKVPDHELKEVVVTAKKQPIVVKGDTTSYNISAFSNGTERKLDEVLKKMPGIEVNSKTGEIKYKGKPIETIQLDGDNLFGYNYTIGTRNIPVQALEQVQAIEHFSENPLLKDLENDDKVVLNLKFKKGKVSVSDELDLAAGIKMNATPALDISSNLLALSAKYKAFGTFSYNDIGINYSPFDYFSMNVQNAEQLKEADWHAAKIINDPTTFHYPDEKRTNLNHAFFGSYNQVMKLSSRWSIRSNLFALHDKMDFTTFTGTTTVTNGTVIATSDKNSITRRPALGRGDIYSSYKWGNKALLEYNARLSNETVTTDAAVVLNNHSGYYTTSHTKSLFLKQQLLYTWKIANKKAVQLDIHYSSNQLPQTFQSALPDTGSPRTIATITQNSEFKKHLLDAKATYLASTPFSKLRVSAGCQQYNTPFHSLLDSGKTAHNMNQFTYRTDKVYASGEYILLFKKWRIAPAGTVEMNRLQYTNTPAGWQQTVHAGLFKPTIHTKYQWNDKTALSASFSFQRKPVEEIYFFTNPVVISNRVSVVNQPEIRFQNSYVYQATLLHSNLYKRHLLSLGLTYIRTNGGFFPMITIQPYQTQLLYFYANYPGANANVQLLLEKYFSSLESTVRLTSNFSAYSYMNIVNESNRRQNHSFAYETELFAKTAFDSKVNFENTCHFEHTWSTTGTTQAFANSSLHNNARVVIKPDKTWLLSVSHEFYNTGIGKHYQTYHFLDAGIYYKPSGKPYQLSLTAKNLLNYTRFTQLSITDYSSSLLQNSLMPGYCMVRFSYRL